MEKVPICRRIEGNLVFIEENLDKISKMARFDPDIPTAVVSFIGEKGSGKTIYTNLLIQSLRHNCTGGWLDKVDGNSAKRNQVTPLPGFPRCSSEDTKYSEVCLWPETFYLQSRGKSMLVLILHTEYEESDPRSNDVDSLEVFLSLVCSKIVEIHWQNDEFRFRGIHRDLKECPDNIYGNLLCSNVVYLIRSDTTSTQLDAANGTHICSAKSVSDIMSGETTAMIEDLKYFFVTCVPNQVKNIQSSKGYLKLDLNTYDAIYSSINMIADDEHMFPKTISNKKNFLLGGSFNEHVRTCVEISNNIFKLDRECSIFKHPPKCQTRESLPKNSSGTETITLESSSERKETKYHFRKQSNVSQFSDSDSSESCIGPSRDRIVKDKSNDETTHFNLMLSTLQLVTKTADAKLLDILREWSMTNMSFKLVDVLGQCLHNSRLLHCEQIEKLSYSEQAWVFDSALKQLTNDHSELKKVESLLESFSSIPCNEKSNAKALWLFLKTQNLENEMTGNNLLQKKAYRKFVLNICKNSVLKYISENRSTDVFLCSLEQMRNFYIEEMKRYIEMGPFSRKSLGDIHDLLLRHCTKSILDVMSWNLECDLTENQSQLNKICKQRLQTEFVDFQKTNTKVLSIVNKRLSSLIAKSKVKYDETIVQVVNCRASLEHLKAAHVRGKNQAIQFLNENIQQVRRLEPVVCHQQTLIALIDSDWSLLTQLVTIP
ncbi:unnamed protein product [Orchesella dallaii]|uniref:Uncharacterized protein n=1 Tax=Orchesella dallaii TaxID=48710 RepID=A0ABP1RQT5_9HEXA